MSECEVKNYSFSSFKLQTRFTHMNTLRHSHDMGENYRYSHISINFLLTIFKFTVKFHILSVRISFFSRVRNESEIELNS